MGNNTLIVELYDTMVNKVDFSLLTDIKNKYQNLPERDPGEHWYDSIKLKESISKKAKKQLSQELNLLALEHLKAYLDITTEKLLDIEMKNELSSKYVNGLLQHGGPSTDVFIKMFGIEKTTHLYKKILFGIN
jgi:hypothetical protein